MGDSERDIRPGFCLACGFCDTTYPNMLKPPVLLVEAAEANVAGAVDQRERGVCSGLTLQPLLCSSRCSCLEKQKLVPKPLQWGSSREGRRPGPGILELTSFLLFLLLTVFLFLCSSVLQPSRLCAQGQALSRNWKRRDLVD